MKLRGKLLFDGKVVGDVTDITIEEVLVLQSEPRRAGHASD